MSNIRRNLLATTILVGASIVAGPAWAQEDQTPVPVPPGQVQEPVIGEEEEAVDESAPVGEIVVTGSRIARPNLEANSPIAVVTGEETVEQGDITLETYLNTLPQANPAGTTTSNNPGNGGQANINLRGLGSNRNLILIDGRRPMVSDTSQTVDVNTIPQALIERIEIVTGGAGAAYGADAIAGVVNIRMRRDFEGIDLRGSYLNSVPEMDAEEYQISGVFGGNFADGRGNLAIAAEYSQRESLIKAERAFAAQATSTTSFFPTGRFTASGANPIPQSAIDALFLSYGVDAEDIPTQGLLGFNTDGTLFGIGTFNDPRDVANFRYGIDSAANPNLNFFPDFYSYNFDIVNLLVLPLERKSVFSRGHFEISPAAEVFVQGGYTEYEASSALAPTPVSVPIKAPGENTPTQAFSPLIESGFQGSGFIVPITNPFIPADLATLLAARSGDDPRFVGAGATEPFLIGKRFLDTGLREQVFENQVLQGLIGLRGDITNNWSYETYVSWGRTTIDQEARGNVNVQRVQELLESPTGGTELCEGGFNPFGIQPLSDDCVEFVDEVGRTSTEFTQRIIQGYITGELAQLPAGALSIVLGAEDRAFRYDFDPGALFGPIAGFNTTVPAGGTNSFRDYFGELLIPIARDRPWAQEFEVNLTARHSTSDFNDIVNEIDGDEQGSWAYGVTASYQPIDPLRLRGSYQRSVRAPNFGELFSGGGSFPQIFDPCSLGTNFRETGGAAARDLCAGAGFPGFSLGSLADTFVATPGGQAFIGFSGNTDLAPEKADTFTLGAVFNALGFTGSLDYYNIRLKDTIFAPDPNIIIGQCYGYLGGNPDLNPDNLFCSTLFRFGGNIGFIGVIPEELGGDENGYFQFVNQGQVKTSGIDLQLGYNLPTDFLRPRTNLNLNLLVNYLIDFKIEELPGLTVDYADTVAYFGAGLGQSFPRWKGNLNAAWTMDPITLSTRIRYIDGMENRAIRQFPGEDQAFSGPGSVWYFDFAAEANIDNIGVRLGVNNAFDRQPEVYSPNVQSGTDPSLYDVIGRRMYVQVRLRY